MKHLDLFSGIGGFALAARWMGWKTIGFVEIDPFCQKVLRKHWPGVQIESDVRQIDGSASPIRTVQDSTASVVASGQKLCGLFDSKLATAGCSR